jgi:hypothetical protein
MKPKYAAAICLGAGLPPKKTWAKGIWFEQHTRCKIEAIIQAVYANSARSQ